MASPFDIPTSAYDGFSALVKMGPGNLVKLISEVRGRKLTLDSASLSAQLASVIRVEPHELEVAVSSALIPLSGLRADFRMTANDFMALISEVIKEHNPDWYDSNQADWTSVIPQIEELVGPDSYFGHLNKAFRLLTNRPAVVDEIKVVTEQRPVFDDEVKAVVAYLITSTMAVNYRESGERKKMHFNLDVEDLHRLQEQVERALKKVQLLEKQAALLEVPALVVGTEVS